MKTHANGAPHRVNGAARPEAVERDEWAAASLAAYARPPLPRQIALGLVVFGIYAAVAGLGGAVRSDAASRHARSVFSLEQRLHLDVEPSLNQWLAPHHTLRVLANYEYATTYVLSAFILIFWVWARRPEIFRWTRNSFVLLNLAAVAVFALYPLTPPRLMPEQGFVDTVYQGHTWGSWGSPLVGHANQLAAMPSLHFAWAVWVSVVLAYVAGGLRWQLASAVHVLVTLWVILATANHYLLDAAAGVALAWVSVAVAGRFGGRDASAGPPVAAADMFFLHVESDRWPQHVGGVVVLDDPAGRVTREAVAAVVQSTLPDLPRFRQRLAWPSRWHRPTWQWAHELDWAWHVPQIDLERDGDTFDTFDTVVARLAATPLPRDRPLWRFAVVPDIAPGRTGVVLVVHHVIADGVGTVLQALHLLEPVVSLPSAERPHVPAWKAAAGVTTGLARLAVRGRAHGRLPVADTAQRSFTRVTLDLAEARDVARRNQARVSDVLLTLVVAALQSGGGELPAELRVAVPLMVRDPFSAAEGNVTAAVMVDVPTPRAEPLALLRAVAGRTGRLSAGSLALASRFVMQDAADFLPVPAHARFARTVYGPRFFHGIVSNMPGPPVQLSLAGAPIAAAYPLLPLAPRTALAVGALGWNGSLCVSVAAHPALVGDGTDFAAAMRTTFGRLRAAPPVDDLPTRPPAAGGDTMPGNARSAPRR